MSSTKKRLTAKDRCQPVDPRIAILLPDPSSSLAYKNGEAAGRQFLAGFVAADHADRIKGFMAGLKADLKRREEANDEATNAANG